MRSDADGAATSAVEVEHEELWQAVLRAAIDPIIVVDHEGIILRSNDATERLFGYASDYLVGLNVSVLMPEPHQAEHDGYMARYLETGEAKIIGIGREVEAQKADGQVFPISLAVSEVKLADRSWFTGIIHDLTARKQAEAELLAVKADLEERVKLRTAELEASLKELARSNRDLEQFAYIASHDLQAPLRNVRQGLELLDEHLEETLGAGFDAEAEELWALTVAAAQRMEQLILGLLSYSRLDRMAGTAAEPVDLRLLAEELIGQMSTELASSNAEVELADLPTVFGDEIQLRQLLQNLLENAVKYRDDGRPLRISLSAKDRDGAWLVSVGDNGIGIDPDQRERVFELFRRADPTTDGVGLGLAICQRIVERHGGDIWVDVGPNGGSTFSFTLPRTLSR